MDFEENQEDHDQQHMASEFNNLKMDTGTRTPEPQLSPEPPVQPRKLPRYKECLKNHALSLGGHAVDGCGEFMPAGTEGTLDALKCAACNCHRNFHRKETEEHNSIMPVPLPMPMPQYFGRSGGGYLHVGMPQQQRLLALPCSSSGGGQYGREEYNEDHALNSSGGGSGKKRFRTKFTQEQKEKMFELAERLGWRIQKHDEDAVQQFCDETGVQRNVFKVWMHNNKNTLGKKP